MGRADLSSIINQYSATIDLDEAMISLQFKVLLISR